ncbi:hypothetical protein CK203_076007 [Vitis vinifera]|uniref:Reverse transcriptase zinc-binding domain-containing protein n=1 Tax=Vitis vinifera TaxID=29760 RepID=A0A438C2D0_VITVI|nr:hypothetical protein CK203_076007 [Vitis vinifera]
MNKVLLSKWNWCFTIESEALWKQVISHKYGVEEGGWCTRAVSGRHGVGLWKAIKKEWLGMYSSLAYRMGSGRRVNSGRTSDGVGDGWTPLFSRAFNDWEIEMVERFMLKIQAFRVQREDEDKVRAKVPPKVAFFAWEASWGKILTMEQLQRRGYSLANRCFLCLSEEETVDHLLLHCVKMRALWSLLFSLFGVAWVLSGSVKETLLGWHGAFVGKTRKKA